MPEQVLKILHQTYPSLKHYLNFSNNLQLLVATILSAQIRDTVVNATTPALFAKYKTASDYVKTDLSVLTSEIKAVTFAGNKAKHIIEACRIITEKYNGKVPGTMEELVELPGIGRKSANAILQNGFNIIEGIVVDTHVLRVAYRLGWTTNNKNAEKTESELINKIPRAEWKTLPWLMKVHGRVICKAPVPLCSKCPVDKLCPKQGVKKKL